MRKCKIFITLFAIITVLIVTPVSVSAETGSYTYNHWGEVVPAPNAYIAKRQIDGVGIGIDSFSHPKDIFVAENGCIYISDTGNNRIVCLNKDYSLRWIWNKIYDGTKEIKINSPSGLFVDSENNVYICLTDDAVVLKCSPEQKLLTSFKSPNSPLLNKDFVFQPSHILVSDSGITYVLIDGFYLGALVYDESGTFLTFFGSNDVKVTAKMISDKLFRKIMTEKQKSKLSRYVPIQYDGFDIDEKGFVYTCTKSVYSQEIRRLNTLGDNVLQYKGNMGDLQTALVMGKIEDTQFIDLCVDKNGFISAIDKNRGRVFQYNKEGTLLTIMGGSGDGLGLFKNAIAIDNYENKLFVLDNELGNITVFQETEYGELLHKGIVLYQDGLYTESADIWKEILKMDVNSEVAYNGLGKALHAEEDYVSAMDCFKKSNNREDYSESYKQYRNIQIKRYFPIVALVIIVLITAVLILNRLLKNRPLSKQKRDSDLKSVIRFLNHTADECGEIKYKNTWNIRIATVTLVFFFLAFVAKKQLTGFIFNSNNPNNFNVLVELLITVGVFLLYVIINWAITTLLSGKGKIKEIYCGTAYALIPYIISLFISVVCSQFLTMDEQSFLMIIELVSLIWTSLVLLSALKVIHEYSFTKVIFSLLLTVLGMAFVVFIIMLFISIAEQFVSFFKTIYSEIMFRR